MTIICIVLDKKGIEMKVVCAWCGKYLGDKSPDEDERVTSGICETCLQKLKREFRSVEFTRKGGDTFVVLENGEDE